MVRLLAADDVPAASRRDYWHHALDDTIGPLELSTDRLDGRDRIRAGGIGALHVVDLTTSRPGVAVLTAKGVRASDPELCKIDALVRGHGVVEQDGRQARLQAGDLVFVDLSRPVQWAMSSMRVVAVVFPRALLPLRREDTAALTGTRIAGDRGVAALVSSLARELADHLDDEDAAGGMRTGTAVLDLVAAGLTSRLDRHNAVAPDIFRRSLLVRVQAFIEERLADPELSPGMIASAHHVSVRYLYRLFEDEGVSVAAWIRRRRLERCRRDLLDPALRRLQVRAIGARWGMRDATQFSRAFRRAYGVPPGEYRALGPTQ
jgi:AraC-like DNA-binding protein